MTIFFMVAARQEQEKRQCRQMAAGHFLSGRAAPFPKAQREGRQGKSTGKVGQQLAKLSSLHTWQQLPRRVVSTHLCRSSHELLTREQVITFTFSSTARTLHFLFTAAHSVRRRRITALTATYFSHFRHSGHTSLLHFQAFPLICSHHHALVWNSLQWRIRSTTRRLLGRRAEGPIPSRERLTPD